MKEWPFGNLYVHCDVNILFSSGVNRRSSAVTIPVFVIRSSVVSPKQLAYIAGRQSFGDAMSGRDSRPTSLTGKLRDTILDHALVAAVDRHLRAGGLGEKRAANFRRQFGDVAAGDFGP